MRRLPDGLGFLLSCQELPREGIEVADTGGSDPQDTCGGDVVKQSGYLDASGPQRFLKGRPALEPFHLHCHVDHRQLVDGGVPGIRCGRLNRMGVPESCQAWPGMIEPDVNGSPLPGAGRCGGR